MSGKQRKQQNRQSRRVSGCAREPLWRLPDDIFQVNLRATVQGFTNSYLSWPNRTSRNDLTIQTIAISSSILMEKMSKDDRQGSNNARLFHDIFTPLCVRAHKAMNVFFEQRPDVYRQINSLSYERRAIATAIVPDGLAGAVEECRDIALCCQFGRCGADGAKELVK